MAEKLTATDRENIQAYLSAMKALEAKEPEYNFADEASAEAWEAWNAECLATTNKYQDSIKRALLFSLGDMTCAAPQSVAAILSAFVDSGQITTSTTARRAEIIEYPLDKINCVIWGLLERDTAGQIAIAAEKRGSKKEISILYSINFDNLGDEVTISKRLLPFDKRVYIAVSALFNAGNNVISLTQIHYAMGNTSRPKAGQLQRINEAIKKMNGAAITVDNSQEIAANYKYMKFKYEGSLLPLERIEASVNGQLTDAAIHIFREPPVITFAKKRNQITTIPVKLLQSPMNKTDANLQLEDYLLERISREARGKGKTARLLYKTIFDHAGISTAKQKQRAPEKIEKYLQYYTKTNFIKGYAMEADGVTIIFA